MNKKSILAILPAAALLAACSNDSAPQPAEDLQQIQFSVTVPNAPRDVATTTTNINAFTTWAFVGGQTYLDGITVTKGANGWEYNPTAYWPANESLNFYSISPALTEKLPTAVNDNNPDIAGFSSPGNVDLLYGVNMGVTRKDKKVNVNFRHALSQIRFLLRKQPAEISGVDINVKVSEVKLFNISNTGSFTFPRETTSPNTPSEGTPSARAVGAWSALGTPSEMDIFTNAAVDLTDNYSEVNNSNPKRVFAIPQPLTNVAATADSYSGSYVRVLCLITDAKTGVVVWPAKDDRNYVSDTAGGYLVFPLTQNNLSAWELGKAYRYLLTLGVPSSTDRIDFDVTVDEYSDFGSLDPGQFDK